MSQRSSRILSWWSRTRTRTLAAAMGVGVALIATTGAAQANTSTLPNVVGATITTPAGDFPVIASTVVPAMATYIAPGARYPGGGVCDPWPTNIGLQCESVQFGSDGHGISVSVTFDAPTTVPATLVGIGGWDTVGSLDVPVGSTSVSGLLTGANPGTANYAIDQWQAEGDCFAGVPVAAIQYPWCGVRLYLIPGGPGDWNELGTSCGCANWGDITNPDRSVIFQPIGTFTVAAYAPAALVTGDPWMHFRSIFRAESHLIFKTKGGTIRRNLDWGWLKPGRHTIKFGCGRLHGTFRVHVHGRAYDGAAQDSPITTVACL
jgi:hypothetical protein